jgi:hypothetical protein
VNLLFFSVSVGKGETSRGIRSRNSGVEKWWLGVRVKVRSFYVKTKRTLSMVTSSLSLVAVRRKGSL